MYMIILFRRISCGGCAKKMEVLTASVHPPSSQLTGFGGFLGSVGTGNKFYNYYTLLFNFIKLCEIMTDWREKEPTRRLSR